MTELYFVTESGQMEINFDSLELKTSKEFIEAIKYDLSTVGKYEFFKLFENDNGDITVYLYDPIFESMACHIYFNFEISQPMITSYAIDKRDFLMMAEALGVKI